MVITRSIIEEVIEEVDLGLSLHKTWQQKGRGCARQKEQPPQRPGNEGMGRRDR